MSRADHGSGDEREDRRSLLSEAHRRLQGGIKIGTTD